MLLEHRHGHGREQLTLVFEVPIQSWGLDTQSVCEAPGREVVQTHFIQQLETALNNRRPRQPRIALCHVA